MSKKPETLFKDRIMPQISSLPNTFVMKTQEVSKRGILDLILCINGTFVGIELKKSMGDKADPLQRWNMQRIAGSGGVALLAYPENWDEVFQLLSDIALNGKLPKENNLGDAYE
jgi:hypothetical protein